MACADVPAPSASRCTPGGSNHDIPEGWEEYDGLSCECAIYAPVSRAALPPPVSWQPCPGSFDDDCRVMTHPVVASDLGIGADAAFGVDARGVALLAFSRQEGSLDVHVVAEVDGKVRTALATAHSSPCALSSDALGGEKRVLIATESSGGVPRLRQWALGGSVDELRPDIVGRFSGGSHRAWCGAERVVMGVDGGAWLSISDWSMKPVASVKDPDVLRLSNVHVVGNDVYFDVITRQGLGFGIDVYSGETLAHLVRTDANTGAGSFASDGIDMAWRLGDGPHTGMVGGYSHVRLMAASMVSNPTLLNARAIAALADGAVDNRPVAVGCGLVATTDLTTEGLNDVQIVRISDGWRWSARSTVVRRHDHVVGLTCKEVFVMSLIGEGRSRNISRIAIDVLGPGTAAP